MALKAFSLVHSITQVRFMISPGAFPCNSLCNGFLLQTLARILQQER